MSQWNFNPSPKRLSEQDAWAVAMAWQPHVQNKVQFVVDCDGPVDSIVKSYAWVRINDPNVLDHEGGMDDYRGQLLSLKRAVMLTWSALAACPGYRGSENGVFWKRVISELQAVREPLARGHWRQSSDQPDAVTDAYGFFDLPGQAFPRFLVETPFPMRENFHTLFTVKGPEMAPEISAKLEQLLARLRPHTDTTATSDRVDVSLRVPGFFTDGEERRLSALVDTVNNTTPSLFRIRQLHVASMQFSSEANVDSFLELTRGMPVAINHFEFHPLFREVSRATQARCVQAFLRLDGYGVRAQVTSVDFPRSVGDVFFRGLISALPFATSIHSLTFDAEYVATGGQFERTALPWIAYAIFHPRAPSSSWRQLALTQLMLTNHSTHVLTAMARGNNLLALLNGTPPDSDAYYNAQLSAGTVVRVDPCRSVLDFVPGLGGEVLYAAPTDVTVDVCGISSLDRTTWSVWVAVIVPAYGLGWVRAHQLKHVRAHAPATHSLAGLRLRRVYNYGRGPVPDDTPEVLLHVLRPLGAMLTFLDVLAYSNMTASTLDELLRACPSLKTLVVDHDGELWSESSSFVPRETPLEELHLHVTYDHPTGTTPAQRHLNESLRHLRALRLQVYDPQVDRLSASQVMLERVLAHVPSLRYLHWQNDGANHSWSDHFHGPIPYAHSMQWTPRALQQLQLTHDKYLYGHQRLSASSAAAFLSVVAYESEIGGSALGQLVARGVLSTIFLFATSPVRRVIHIEPNSKIPPENATLSGSDELDRTQEKIQ